MRDIDINRKEDIQKRQMGDYMKRIKRDIKSAAWRQKLKQRSNSFEARDSNPVIPKYKRPSSLK